MINKQILSDPTVQKAVAVGTSALGAANALDAIQVGLGIAGVLAGLVLTVLIIRKTLVETKILKDKEERRKRRAIKRGLTRRADD